MMTISPATQTKPAASLQRIPFGSSAADVARVLERDGGVILTEAITRDEVAAINRDLDPYFEQLSTGNFDDGSGSFIANFYGHTTKRLLHCVKLSKTLRDRFYNRDVLAEYLSATISGPPGSYTMVSSQGIEIHPGEKAQELHRDGGSLMEIFGIANPRGNNLLVNALIALTDVTEEMGATRVIPGSNLWDDYARKGTHEQTIPATLNAGDVLFISGKILHGGGANVTKDRPRRVLSSGFSLGVLLGEEAWPHAISVDEVRTYPERLQAYLGFHSISLKGERPGFLWRVQSRPLEQHLGLK
jgi:hypothetical protein